MPDGRELRFDARGRLAVLQDVEGRRVQLEYDPVSARLRAIRNGAGATLHLNSADRPARLGVSLRGLLVRLIDLGQVRLELASVEVRAEAVRLGELVMYGLIAGVMLSLGLGFLAILITVILWDNNRLLALGVFAAIFLTLGVVAGLLARARLNQSSSIWSATVEELERDKESLRP